MNILIINSNQFKQPVPVIPIGALCVATSLHHAGHKVRFVDLCFSNDCEQDIANALAQFPADLVGLSIRNIDNAGYDQRFLLEETRDKVVAPLLKCYDGPVVIGGPAVGISAEQMLAFLGVPYAIQGDGELAIVQLANALERDEPLADIQGLVCHQNGATIINNPPHLVADLDSLPTPDAARFLDVRPYYQLDSPLQVQTKRGCVKRCTYCVYNKIEGTRYRLRSPELVVADIVALTEATGIRYVEFTDSTFNAPLSHAKQVLRHLIDAKLDLKLRTMGLNPAHVDEELVDLMKEAGFSEIDLGVESCSDTILQQLGKDYSVADVVRAAKLLRKKRLPVSWFLMLGAPGETVETLRETFTVVNETAHPWDLIVIAVGIRLYNGAPLAEQVLANNSACTNDHFLSPVMFEPSSISLDEIKRLAKEQADEHPNYFMWDEDGTAPEPVMKLMVTTSRLLGLRQPTYRMHIALRTLKQRLRPWTRGASRG